MNNSVTYCRLCAVLKPENEITNLLNNAQKCKEINIKLSRVNALMDFNRKEILLTVCSVCLELLDVAYDFVIAVERAQVILNKIYRSPNEKNPITNIAENKLNSNYDENTCYESQNDENPITKKLKVRDTDKNISCTVDNAESNKIEKSNNFNLSISCSNYNLPSNMIPAKTVKDNNNRIKLRKSTITKKILTEASPEYVETDQLNDSLVIINNLNCNINDNKFPNDQLATTNNSDNNMKIGPRSNSTNEILCTEPIQIDEQNKSLDNTTNNIAHKSNEYDNMELTFNGSNIKKILNLNETLKSNKTIDEENVGNNPEIIKYPEVEPTWQSFIWKCSSCGTHYQSSDELITHSMEVHSQCNSLSCPYCKTKKYSLNNFIRHIFTKHKKGLKLSCYKCYETFPTFRAAANHKTVHRTTNYMCPGCNTCFSTPDEVKMHCDQYYNTMRDLKALLADKTEGSTCLICKKTLKHPRHLIYHISQVHSDQRKHICELCGKAFKIESHLQAHYISHSDSKPFKCKFCKYAFKTLSKLKYHVQLHDNELKFPCEQCGKIFKRKQYLKRHSLVHSDDTPWKCDQCNKSFKRKEFLNAHFMRQHSGERRYSCDICSNSYVDWPNYNKHMTGVHGKDMSKRKRTPQGVFHVDLNSGELVKPQADAEVWRAQLKLDKGKRHKSQNPPL